LKNFVYMENWKVEKAEEKTREELEEEIEEKRKRIEKLKEQDESDFSEFEKSVKGKEGNILLLKKQIKHAKELLRIKKRNSLERYF